MKNKSILQEILGLKKETEETKSSFFLFSLCTGEEILKWEIYGEMLLMLFFIFQKKKTFLALGYFVPRNTFAVSSSRVRLVSWVGRRGKHYKEGKETHWMIATWIFCAHFQKRNQYVHRSQVLLCFYSCFSIPVLHKKHLEAKSDYSVLSLPSKCFELEVSVCSSVKFSQQLLLSVP